jgi:chromosomal replication initiation ATPase DnaA
MSKKWPVFFGSDNFILSMREKYYKDKLDKEIPDSRILFPSCQIIKKIVCEAYKILSDDIYTYQKQNKNEPRNVAIFLSRTLNNDTLKKISKEYHLKSSSSVNSIVRKFKKQLTQNSKVKLNN